jgi:pteridine reductase
VHDTQKPLEGKKILITGAAKRIGRSLALACAEAGADIVIHYNQSAPDACQLKNLIEKMGKNAHTIQADLNNLTEVEKIIPAASQESELFGLINNASIFQPITWEKTTLVDWQYHLNVNLTAPFILSQMFAKSLSQVTQGQIINMLDWRALRPGPDHFPYTISKSALVAMTRSLATALAPNINVNGIALGAILPPPNLDTEDHTVLDNILSSVPQQRWGNLADVNQAALFFLTGPTYMTGEIIHIDGGRHLL